MHSDEAHTEMRFETAHSSSERVCSILSDSVADYKSGGIPLLLSQKAIDDGSFIKEPIAAPETPKMEDNTADENEKLTSTNINDEVSSSSSSELYREEKAPIQNHKRLTSFYLSDDSRSTNSEGNENEGYAFEDIDPKFTIYENSSEFLKDIKVPEETSTSTASIQRNSSHYASSVRKIVNGNPKPVRGPVIPQFDRNCSNDFSPKPPSTNLDSQDGCSFSQPALKTEVFYDNLTSDHSSLGEATDNRRDRYSSTNPVQNEWSE